MNWNKTKGFSKALIIIYRLTSTTHLNLSWVDPILGLTLLPDLNSTFGVLASVLDNSRYFLLDLSIIYLKYKLRFFHLIFKWLNFNIPIEIWRCHFISRNKHSINFKFTPDIFLCYSNTLDWVCCLFYFDVLAKSWTNPWYFLLKF